MMATTFDRLPPAARKRATALQSAADVARAAGSELSARLRELRQNRQGIAGHVRNVTDARFSGSRSILPESKIKGELQRLADLDGEIARLDAIVQEQSAAAAEAGSLIARVEEFLRGMRPECAMSDCSTPPPALKKGEPIADAIEARRQRVRELERERRAVEAAPIPSAVAKKLAREQVARLAERGRVDVDPLVSTGDPFRFARTLGLVKMPPSGAGSVETTDTEATVAWLFRDQLTAALDAEIDRTADDAHALDNCHRAAKLAQLAHDRLGTVREEARLIESAAEQGLTIAHRTDIDARALLGIETTLAARAA